MTEPAFDPDLREALYSAERIMRGDPRDWSVNRHDAFLFGLFRGWDCEQDHSHTANCTDMASVAAQHDWDAAFVDRLRRLRRGVRAASEVSSPE